MKPTPGPWTISHSEDGTILIKPIPGQVICELDPTPEAEANAKLIAAAPELLEALKLCVAELRDWMRNHGEDSGTLEAINKANTAMGTL